MPFIEAHDLHGESITIDITPGTPVGQVYRDLGDSVHHLVKANEVEVPLREVLAEVYGLKDPPSNGEMT
jgi:siderophore synthetase component